MTFYWLRIVGISKGTYSFSSTYPIPFSPYTSFPPIPSYHQVLSLISLLFLQITLHFYSDNTHSPPLSFSPLYPTQFQPLYWVCPASSTLENTHFSSVCSLLAQLVNYLLWLLLILLLYNPAHWFPQPNFCSPPLPIFPSSEHHGFLSFHPMKTDALITFLCSLFFVSLLFLAMFSSPFIFPFIFLTSVLSHWDWKLNIAGSWTVDKAQKTHKNTYLQSTTAKMIHIHKGTG